MFAVAFLGLFSANSLAQNPVKWELESDTKGKSLAEGEKFDAKLKATIEGNWYLYGVEQPEGGPISTTLSVPENSVYGIAGKDHDTKAA